MLEQHCRVCNNESYRAYLRKNTYEIVECTACQFRFVYPTPSNQELTDVYTNPEYFSNKDLGYQNYTAEKEHHLHEAQKRLDHIERLYPQKGTLLDIGCAAGYFLLAAKERGWKVLGIELSPEMAEQARNEVGCPIVARLEDLTHEHNSIDVITMWEYIEHIPNIDEQLNRISQLLKPQGIVALSTPNTDYWTAQHKPEQWREYKPPAHLSFFNSDQVQRLLWRYGLQTQTVQRTIPRAPTYVPFFQTLLHYIKKSLGNGENRKTAFWWVFSIGWRIMEYTSQLRYRLQYRKADLHIGLEVYSQKKQPSLVYITDSEAFGGAEGHLETLIKNINTDHYQVGLILPKREKTAALVKAAQERNMSVYYLENVHNEGLDIRIIYRTWKLLKRIKPDITHFMLRAPRQAAESLIGAWLAKVPLRIATFHLVTGVPRFKGIKHYLRTLNRVLQYRLFHKGINVSQGNQALLIKEHKFPVKRLTCIPNAIDTTTWKPQARSGSIRKQTNIASNTPLIGIIGRIDQNKGHTILFQAIENVWKTYPDVEIVVIGKGESQKDLQIDAQRIDQQQRIHFLGQQSNIRDVLAEIDIFVQPSHYEGLSFALLEAMAMEKIIIATDTNGTREVIQDTINGLVIPIGNAQALAEHIIEVVENLEQYEKLGKEARKTVLDGYELASQLSQTWEIYRNRV